MIWFRAAKESRAKRTLVLACTEKGALTGRVDEDDDDGDLLTDGAAWANATKSSPSNRLPPASKGKRPRPSLCKYTFPFNTT